MRIPASAIRRLVTVDPCIETPARDSLPGSLDLECAGHGTVSRNPRLLDASCSSESSGRDLEARHHDSMSTYQDDVSGDRDHEARDHRSMSPASITLAPHRASLAARFDSLSADHHHVSSGGEPLFPDRASM